MQQFARGKRRRRPNTKTWLMGEDSLSLLLRRPTELLEESWKSLRNFTVPSSPEKQALRIIGGFEPFRRDCIRTPAWECTNHTPISVSCSPLTFVSKTILTARVPDLLPFTIRFSLLLLPHYSLLLPRSLSSFFPFFFHLYFHFVFPSS